LGDKKRGAFAPLFVIGHQTDLFFRMLSLSISALGAPRRLLLSPQNRNQAV